MLSILLLIAAAQDAAADIVYGRDIAEPVPVGATITLQLADAPVNAVVSYKRTKENGDDLRVGQVVGDLWVGEYVEDRGSWAGSWTTRSVETSAGTVSASDDGADQLLIGITMPFEAADDGTPLRLSNADEVLESAIAVAGNDQDPNISARVREQFDQFSEEALAQIFLKAPTILAGCQAWQLQFDTPYYTESQNPASFGGRTLTVTTEAHLYEIQLEDRTASIRITYSFDKDEFKDMLMGTLESLADGKPIQQKDIDALGEMDNSTVTDCVVDLDTGLALAAQWKRSIEMPGLDAVETLGITADYKFNEEAMDR